LTLLGVGSAIGLYGKFIKQGNMLWLMASVVPFTVGLVVNNARQPADDIQNCYRYLLAKRAATCEFEKNKSRMQALNLSRM
jgi:hypothetical protein